MTRMGHAALLAVMLAGCGSNNAGGNGNQDAATGGGLTPTNKLTNLSRADFNQLCSEEKANGNGKVSCGADGR